MIKRVISGLLSAVMGTVLITTDFNTAKQLSNAKISNEEKTFVNDNMSINATNSLGNYISDAMQQKEQPQKMSYQCVSDYNYDVGFAEFDIETKRLLVYSSQPSDAKVSVIFKNEDTGEAAFTAEYEAKQGKDTINTYDVEIAEFPEFFTIDIMLFNNFNTPVCNPYTITTYTRFVQEMKATDIYDYEEEYVVNLDEDETTNFVILSEDTIQGETTEDTNILVSADYENDQYVFEHIDDTIRYLDKGDHFFIRPTENDIITLSVSDITIDGDRATLTGDENTDGIFDVIKIETQADDISNAVVNEEDIPDNMEYNGIVEDENGKKALKYSFFEEYSYDAIAVNNTVKEEVVYKFDPDGDEPEEVDLSKPNWSNTKIDNKQKQKKLKADPSVTGQLKFSAEFGFQFYQKGFHLEFEIKFSPSFAIEVEVGCKITAPLYSSPNPIGWVVIPGLWFGVKPEITLTADGKIKYSKTYGFVNIWSLDTSRDDWFKHTCTPVEDAGYNVTKIEADISITIDAQPQFWLFSEHVAAIKLSIPLEFGIKCSTNNLSDNGVLRSDKSPLTMFFQDQYNDIFGFNFDKDTVHSCGLCLSFKPYVSFKIEFVLKIKCIPFTDDIKATILELDTRKSHNEDIKNFKIYYSISHNEKDFGDCPYKAYKTTFDLNGSMEVPDAGAEVTVDGIKGLTDMDGIVKFYCENGTHSYSVSVDGKEIKSGSFTIDNAVKFITISLVEEKEDSSDGDKIVITEPVVTGFNMPSHVEEIPEMPKERICMESGRLGDQIFYFIYPNGEMNIHGTGEMYDNAPSITNISKVTTAYFIDTSPENGEYITSISNGLFKDAENLETVYLSNEITKIGNEAFSGCKSLKYFRYGGENDTTETLVLPEKLDSIGNSAFRNCSSAQISDLIIPDSVTYVGDLAFSNCFNINKITIGSLDLICDHPLYSILNSDECDDTYYSQLGTYLPYSLKTIVVKDGDTIPNKAFYMMSGIEEIDLPEGITSISNEAFYGCSKANFDCKKLFENVETIGASAFYNCKKAEFGDLTFSDTTKTIGSNAFYGCKGIKSLVIPETVDTVMAGAFGSCSGIKSIIIESENTNFKGLGNWGIKQIFVGCDSLEKIQYPIISTSDSDKKYIIGALFQESENGNVIIPASLKTIIITQGTEIDNNTFWGLQEKNITKVVLPDTIEKIGNDSFIKFNDLEEIIIPKNVTEIGLRAFQKCNSLKKVYLHDNIKHIGEAAFEECTGIEEVNYEGSDEQWNDIIIEDRNDPIKRGNVKVNFNVPAPTEDTPVEWVSGDANGDGEIDMSDIVLIMQALANPDRYGVNGTDPTHITENGFKYGDVNGDGLTVKDAQHIQLYLLGKISSLV